MSKAGTHTGWCRTGQHETCSGFHLRSGKVPCGCHCHPDNCASCKYGIPEDPWWCTMCGKCDKHCDLSDGCLDAAEDDLTD